MLQTPVPVTASTTADLHKQQVYLVKQPSSYMQPTHRLQHVQVQLPGGACQHSGGAMILLTLAIVDGHKAGLEGPRRSDKGQRHEGACQAPPAQCLGSLGLWHGS